MRHGTVDPGGRYGIEGQPSGSGSFHPILQFCSHLQFRHAHTKHRKDFGKCLIPDGFSPFQKLQFLRGLDPAFPYQAVFQRDHLHRHQFFLV